jgi:hypothetical protein
MHDELLLIWVKKLWSPLAVVRPVTHLDFAALHDAGFRK